MRWVDFPLYWKINRNVGGTANKKESLRMCQVDDNIIIADSGWRLVLENTTARREEIVNKMKDEDEWFIYLFRQELKDSIKIFGNCPRWMPRYNKIFPVECTNCNIKHSDYKYIGDLSSTGLKQIKCCKCKNVDIVTKSFCSDCDKKEIFLSVGFNRRCSICG